MTVLLENCQKSAVKHLKEKRILLNFVNLSTILFPRFSEQTYFIFWTQPRPLGIYILFRIIFRLIHIAKCLKLMTSIQRAVENVNFEICTGKWKKITVNQPIEKPILRNFANLFKIFYRGFMFLFQGSFSKLRNLWFVWLCRW